MTLYYIETDFGCGIREAKNIQQARKDMREEAGSFLQVVRKATKDEVAWVRGMGGHIPSKKGVDDLGSVKG